MKFLESYVPFTDQEPFPVPVIALLAEYDKSEPYEVDTAAVFLTESLGFLGCIIWGCSCWPDRGGTRWSKVCEFPQDLEEFFCGNDWLGNYPEILSLIQKSIDAGTCMNWEI
jgi:hypothetical protein